MIRPASRTSQTTRSGSVHTRNDGAGDKGEELAIMEVVLKSQYMQERLADTACDLYASSCSLARLDLEPSVVGALRQPSEAVGANPPGAR